VVAPKRLVAEIDEHASRPRDRRRRPA
jgi:hypothetical protein